MLKPPEPIERPAEHLIRRFHTGMLKDRTVGLLLTQGFSLVICCKECPRMIIWTPPELAQRFAAHQNLKLADLMPRLHCKGEGGCGSDEVALFPVLYEREWTWPPAGLPH